MSLIQIYPSSNLHKYLIIIRKLIRESVHQKERTSITKLSPLRTYFALLKGFIATGVLYMPKNFRNAGWLWGGIAMFFSFILTHICITLLLKARAKRPGASFTDLGLWSMGKGGMYVVDFFLTVM